MKFLILSCGTGEGHNSAAHAIEEKLIKLGHECEFCDPIALKSTGASKKVSGAYNGLIRNAPALFGVVYKIGAFYESTGLPSPVYWANKKYVKELYEHIVDGGFDCAIATHLYSMMALTELRRSYMPTLPAYGIMTDYTAIPFYSETALDGYFAPTEEAKAEMVKKHIPQEKIYVTGIPVSDKFSYPISREEARRQLDIPIGARVIAVMSGGVGCGNQVKLCKLIADAADEKDLIYVFTGKNEKLARKLEELSSEYENIISVTFTNEINLYINAADVVLSKPGGLSSTEIAASHIPLVHLKEIPGCETKNVEWFSSHGCSLPTKTERAAADSAVRILNDPSLAREMTENQKKYIPADASLDILVRIFAFIAQSKEKSKDKGDSVSE